MPFGWWPSRGGRGDRDEQPAAFGWIGGIGGITGDAGASTAAERCVVLLQHSVSTLPLRVTREPDGTPEPVPRWLMRPVPFLQWDWPSFCEAVVGDLLRHGDAFMVPVRGGSSQVAAVWPVPAEWVTVSASIGAEPVYSLAGVGSWQGELVHLRYATRAGRLEGTSPMGIADTPASMSAATTEIGLGMAENAFHQLGYFSVGGGVGKPQLDQLKASLEARHAGRRNAFRAMVLADTVEWHQIGISPKEAQLTEMSEWSGREVCRAFGVPPSLVGLGEASSTPYRNQQELLNHFHTFAVAPIVRKIEAAMTALLPTGIECDLVQAALLRGSPVSRAQVGQVMLQGDDVFTPDEIREVFGLPPLPDGQGGKVRRATRTELTEFGLDDGEDAKESAARVVEWAE